MKQTWKMRKLAFQIEWHWWFIMRGRKRGSRMIDKGEPLISEKLLRLDRNLTQHGIAAMNAQKKYEDLAGITALLCT